MSPDAIHQRAWQHALDISAKVELAIRDASNAGESAQALLAVVGKARGYAADAIVDLATADPSEIEGIRKLQNRVAVYRLLIECIGEIIIEGFDAGEMMLLTNRNDLATLVGLDDDEATALERETANEE